MLGTGHPPPASPAAGGAGAHPSSHPPTCRPNPELRAKAAPLRGAHAGLLEGTVPGWGQRDLALGTSPGDAFSIANGDALVSAGCKQELSPKPGGGESRVCGPPAPARAALAVWWRASAWLSPAEPGPAWDEGLPEPTRRVPLASATAHAAAARLGSGQDILACHRAPGTSEPRRKRPLRGEGQGSCASPASPITPGKV